MRQVWPTTRLKPADADAQATLRSGATIAPLIVRRAKHPTTCLPEVRYRATGPIHETILNKLLSTAWLPAAASFLALVQKGAQRKGAQALWSSFSKSGLPTDIDADDGAYTRNPRIRGNT